MKILSLVTALKALRQLGLTQVTLNAVYKFGLISGHYRRVTHAIPNPVNGLQLQSVMPVPSREQMLGIVGEAGIGTLLAEADEIVDGKFRQFGALAVAINLEPAGPLSHWCDYESGKIRHQEDIKFTWEPARFGWAFILGRAYHASHNEKYALAFWHLFESFIAGNPPYLGPNWTSGQEVGLRLIAFVWGAQVFATSKHSSRDRLCALANATANHARRIPPTLVYARSQNNNHLLTEATALVTAGLALPGHPDSNHWLSTGRKWLSWCFTHQIDGIGEYAQHSTNYQRLMLQSALWIDALDRQADCGPVNSNPGNQVDSYKRCLDDISRNNLGRAARWLMDMLDPESGCVPNLGANDGALILPLSNTAFSDFRPVAQASALAFLHKGLPAGGWDEMALWFGLDPTGNRATEPDQAIPNRSQDDSILTLRSPNSWCYLRAVHYTSRPSHADQLHLDLWWRGVNIAQDAGTYQYNASSPWDNRLTSTLVHNTISLDGREQMTRASRFLYLDWVDATYGACSGGSNPENFIQLGSAQIDSFAGLKISHTRTATVFKDEHWLVDDRLLNKSSGVHTYRLHWLLPDWKWELQQNPAGLELRLNSPYGWVTLAISTNQPIKRGAIIRAGELLHGAGLVSPVYGWVSPTYSLKIPALSLAVEVQSEQDVHFKSEFIFPS